MSSSCHFPKPLSSNAIRAVDTFLSKSETARNTRTADIFWLSTIFHFFCHLLEWCRAIIKSCRADFSSNRNSSSSPCPELAGKKKPNVLNNFFNIIEHLSAEKTNLIFFCVNKRKPFYIDISVNLKVSLFLLHYNY